MVLWNCTSGSRGGDPEGNPVAGLDHLADAVLGGVGTVSCRAIEDHAEREGRGVLSDGGD